MNILKKMSDFKTNMTGMGLQMDEEKGWWLETWPLLYQIHTLILVQYKTKPSHQLPEQR